MLQMTPWSINGPLVWFSHRLHGRFLPTSTVFGEGFSDEARLVQITVEPPLRLRQNPEVCWQSLDKGLNIAEIRARPHLRLGALLLPEAELPPGTTINFLVLDGGVSPSAKIIVT